MRKKTPRIFIKGTAQPPKRGIKKTPPASTKARNIKG